MASDIRQIDPSELERILSADFDIEKVRSMEVFSLFGWKIVSRDGKKWLSPGTESDYIAFLRKLHPGQPEKHVLKPNPCYQTNPVNCIGAGCCVLHQDPQLHYWICDCP